MIGTRIETFVTKNQVVGNWICWWKLVILFHSFLNNKRNTQLPLSIRYYAWRYVKLIRTLIEATISWAQFFVQCSKLSVSYFMTGNSRSLLNFYNKTSSHGYSVFSIPGTPKSIRSLLLHIVCSRDISLVPEDHLVPSVNEVLLNAMSFFRWNSSIFDFLYDCAIRMARKISCLCKLG